MKEMELKNYESPKVEVIKLKGPVVLMEASNTAPDPTGDVEVL